ncbi:DUF2249 domain-containing protein [Actinomadura sp. 7K507]|uniref:DUF2249 domain-containing protein n=1 Tax=Actinomadura sp. 7K507 TaxID=2530365 RepID=UPI001046F89D|nr:DUF2249 domain-containing protein [Actinomadura sp. 7K507]TDC86306.1 DUF2249 domain-containing protein [Actinomadura sp. 7K507]
MDDIVIASSQDDAVAIEAVKEHHAQLAGALTARADALVAAAARGTDADAEAARPGLVEWCRRELLPHAVAEEEALYPAARRRPEGRLLVQGMLGEHQVIVDLVDEIAAAADPVRAAAAARALSVVFQSHLEKENELVLPLLGADPEVDVADLLAGMHDLLGAGRGSAEETGGSGGHGCGCGEEDGPGYPELDARTIPHAIRHATVFGALDTVEPGGGLVLVAPHDPLPLLAQLQKRSPDTFTVSYRERGPEAWRLLLVRAAETARSTTAASA